MLSESKVKKRTLMFWQDDIQLVMYMCTNSVGSSTAVVSLLTTSIECRLMSILTRTLKYLNWQKRKESKNTEKKRKRLKCWDAYHFSNKARKVNQHDKNILLNFSWINQLNENFNRNKGIVFHQILITRGLWISR